MWQVLAQLARWLPGEAAHRAAVTTLRYNMGPKPAVIIGSRQNLGVHLAGLDFANPLGLAAGFDKNAACFNGAMRLGFGHVEVGTITPLPQTGNPKPRVFRLRQNQAVINRYGFNSGGMAAAAHNLASDGPKRRGIVGVNVGANKTSTAPIDDYRVAVAALAQYADYITLNISSPNTPGLRLLQTRQHLADLLAAGREGLDEQNLHKPLFLKIAPDLHDDDLVAIVETCLEAGVDGIIATNTTISRPSDLTGPYINEAGGLSGAPLFHLATDILAKVAHISKGRLGLVGAGGVANGAQAYAKILIGADLVQLYSGLALEGPQLPGRILQQITAMMAAEGVTGLDEIRGQITDSKAAIAHAARCFEKILARPEKD